jgi:hypothetical protein
MASVGQPHNRCRWSCAATDIPRFVMHAAKCEIYNVTLFLKTHFTFLEWYAGFVCHKEVNSQLKFAYMNSFTHTVYAGMLRCFNYILMSIPLSLHYDEHKL